MYEIENLVFFVCLFVNPLGEKQGEVYDNNAFLFLQYLSFLVCLRITVQVLCCISSLINLPGEVENDQSTCACHVSYSLQL